MMNDEEYKSEYLRIKKVLNIAYGQYFQAYCDCFNPGSYRYGNQKYWSDLLHLLMSQLENFFDIKMDVLEKGFQKAKKRLEADALRKKRKHEQILELHRKHQEFANRYFNAVIELNALRLEAKEKGIELPNDEDDPL